MVKVAAYMFNKVCNFIQYFHELFGKKATETTEKAESLKSKDLRLFCFNC